MASSANLGPVLEKYVDELVESGRYGSRSEVIREGVRLVQEREAALAKLKSEIQKGVDDIEAGRFEDIDVVARRLDERYARMEQEAVKKPKVASRRK